MPNSDLPLDVTIEILLRVPVKSLVRFKYVCKSWHSVIKSPNFISEHLKNSRSSLLHFTYEHLFTGTNPKVFSHFFRLRHTLALLRRENLNLPVNLQIPFSSLSKDIEILGSCNGLICLSLARFGSILLIWNPTTHEFAQGRSRFLAGSYSSIETPPGMELDYPLFGFGFDSINNDYKLVKITTYKSSKPMENSHIKFQVYLTRNDCWREIKKGIEIFMGSVIIDCSMSIVLGGVMYIHTMCEYESRERFVTSFDMGDEAFRKFRLPSFQFDDNGGKSHIYYYWTLSVFKGCLAAICHCTCMCGFSLWVLVNESWTKLVVEPIPEIKWPLEFWEDGEIIYRDKHNRLEFVSAPSIARPQNP